MKTIWTIGHSTRSWDDFLELLKEYQIEVLADVRRFPGSRKFPHFNKDTMKKQLREHNIGYHHFEDLGGRRKSHPDSRNTAWRVESFRAYADYMETRPFLQALNQLTAIASEKRTACMCSEAVWWSCHRSLIADILKYKGWKVLHIMSANNATEHPYTKPAHISEGKLSYEKKE